VISQCNAELVIAIDDSSSGKTKWCIHSAPNVLLVERSILDEVKLKRVFLEKSQIIFHLAALFANQNSIDHPETDLMVSGMGTLRMLEYAQLA
jgi:UDP-glucose 4-epimerase